MPVQYQGLVEEHTAVRTAAALFDVSHMGEFEISGQDAEQFLDHVTCNRVRKIADWQAQYTAFLNDTGGVIDDLIIYRYSATRYLLCVNAANRERDFDWLKQCLETSSKLSVDLVDRSEEYGQIAIQGPNAAKIIDRIAESPVATMRYFSFAEVKIAGIHAIIARTGYTGEDGFEIFVAKDETAKLWRAILEVGREDGLVPAGLGARDTLRLEACLPLHGHELSEERSALQSGLSWIVKFDKDRFIGRDALATEQANGVPRQLVGFFVEDKGIAREGAKILDSTDQPIGVVTSGTQTPTLARALGMAIVDREHSAIGAEVYAEVRGRKLRCKVVSRPFYKRNQ